MIDDNERPLRVGLITPYSGGNLGDGAILDATIGSLRARLPSVELVGITLNPAATTRKHGVPAVSITGLEVEFYSEGLFHAAVAQHRIPTPNSSDDKGLEDKGLERTKETLKATPVLGVVYFQFLLLGSASKLRPTRGRCLD